MKIAIANQLRPYSHLPGVKTAIPLSLWQVQIFPTLIRFTLGADRVHEILLDIKGPVEEFTVMQDLEKRELKVFGKSLKGYFRYFVVQKTKGLCIAFDKLPDGRVVVKNGKEDEKIVHPKEELTIPFSASAQEVDVLAERLSIGIHKSQEWDFIRRRADFAEIFPFWLRLGQSLPNIEDAKEKKGAFFLLQSCRELVEKKDKIEVLNAFKSLFLAGFSGLLSPRKNDEDFLGVLPRDSNAQEGDPLFLLTEGAALIRSLFFQERGDTFSLLPCLPPSFHSGRMVQVRSLANDLIDFEWSKKLLRRAVIRTDKNKTVRLELQSALKRFRLRRSFKEKGKFVSVEDPIECFEGGSLLLDRFQK